MNSIKSNYPVFEANQVLTNEHLNSAFDYLNEQERLTRANLIGIGIVCGLEIKRSGASIEVSKGCGITSEGFLILEPEDFKLETYRELKTLDYEEFFDSDQKKLKYQLWELFPKGEPDSSPLNSEFANGKVVLLFLDLKNNPLRNCSPNNCNDKGREIVVSVRRLLIDQESLKNYLSQNKENTAFRLGDPNTSSNARLNLPDLRLPRFDVPESNIETTVEVLQAFQTVFQGEPKNNIVYSVLEALNQVYETFKPILLPPNQGNPFGNFTQKFGFLNKLPAGTPDIQIMFLQYYYDFFDDLIRAYDEFRSKGEELLCACCPPEGLFPRHLMLGELSAVDSPRQSLYRHYFISSSAISGCEDRAKELIQLFRRMVAMIEQFTENPIPESKDVKDAKLMIKITPSKLGRIPLSDKAIPYYYKPNGTPALYELWSYEKSRKNRSNQNLSYRSGEYKPPSPSFVLEPLKYDIEPYNFLRIEGHLGLDYQVVMERLLSLKNNNRLPVEIIALSTGDVDEKNSKSWLHDQDCHFQDLKALCAILRSEIDCLGLNTLRALFNTQLNSENIVSEIEAQAETKSPFFVRMSRIMPEYKVQPNTLVAYFDTTYIKQDINHLTPVAGEPPIVSEAIKAIGLLVQFYEALNEDFCGFDWEVFYKSYEELKKWHAEFSKLRDPAAQGELTWDKLDRYIVEIIYNCKLKAIEELNKEYRRRESELSKRLTLTHFIKNHPGIQHKGGVPLGGTFIVVYHVGLKERDKHSANEREKLDTLLTSFGKGFPGKPEEQQAYVDQFFIKAQNQNISLGSIKNGLIDFKKKDEISGNKISETIKNLVDGIVIADFYLPYLCCSDCVPVQFVLPKTPPTFTVNVGCTEEENNQWEVTVEIRGGSKPYFYSLNKCLDEPESADIVLHNIKELSDVCCLQKISELPFKLSLNPGKYSLAICDSMGAESVSQCVFVPSSPLDVTKLEPVLEQSGKAYQVIFNVSGGVPPYKVTIEHGSNEFDLQEGENNYSYTINDLKSSNIHITDANNCKKEKKVEPPKKKPETQPRKNDRSPK
jgi:hypothetical protein